MVPPTLFISGGVAVLQLCKEVYVRFKGVKRFRKDCEKLARFVQRIEAFIAETEDEADMTAPGWEQAFAALHESLLEVVAVFEACARFGMLRSLINADDLNLKLNRISGRLMLSLQLIPIQKQKATDKRLIELKEMQQEIRSATFVSVRAAEEQSAQLKRLMDQSRVDASKTQEMLSQVLLLLQDPGGRTISAAAAAAGPGPCGPGGGVGPGQPAPLLRIDPAQLEAEVADLEAEREHALRDKNIMEQQYLEQVIAAISAMEARLQDSEVPNDLRCPITYQLLQDPVILVDSHQTYERAAIEEWLARGNLKDPITGVQLKSTALLPNVLARKMAQEWLQAHPEYAQQQKQFEAAAARAGEASQQHSTTQQQQGVDAGSKAAAAAAAVALTHHIQVGPSKPGKEGLEPAGSSEEQYDGPEVIFDLNPKTAAILAARATVDPAAFGLNAGSGSGSGGGGSSTGSSLSEKQIAQQEYARAVAAAAEAAAQQVPVYAAFHAAAAAVPYQDGPCSPAAVGGPGGANQLGVACSGGSVGSGRSSITFGERHSASSLPSITEHQARDTSCTLNPLGPSGSSGAASYGWPSAPALTYSGVQQHELLLLQQQQQQQRQSQEEFDGGALPRTGSEVARRLGVADNSSTFSRGSREERAAAAAAAAEAAATQQQGGFGLDQLHATLGRAAETRFRMSMRQGRTDTAEQVRAQQQQVQQERAQQRERAYLQQHMEQLMRNQSPSPGGSHHHLEHLASLAASSNSAELSSTPYADYQNLGYDDLRAADEGLAASRPSYQHQFSTYSTPGLDRSPQSSIDAATAAAIRRTRSSQDGGIAGGGAGQPRQVPGSGRDASGTASPDPGSSTSSSAPQTRSNLLSTLTSLAKSRKKPTGGDAGAGDTASVQDDAASVSSMGSGSSRRSVGKSMLGMLKSVKYTMVYQDDKC